MTLLERRWLFATILTGIVILGLAAEFIAPPGADNAYLLYTAGRVLDGAKLYVDILEINPPLIVAFNFPPVLLARMTGLSDLLVFRVGVGLLLGVSILLSQVGLRSIFRDGPVGRRALTLLLAFALFVLPAETFGEREHLMLALVLPYLFAVIARVMGGSIPTRYAHVIGLLAGFGFALKPHFALVWVLLEVWLVAVRRGRPTLRPENSWVAALLLAYAVSVLLLTPEYLDLVRRFGALYLAFFRASLVKTLLFGERSRLPLLALLAYLALRKQCPRPALLTGLALTVAGLVSVATIQQKGWNYHFYPASATALVLLSTIVVTVQRPLTSLARRIYGVVAFGVVIAVMASAILVSAWRVADPRGPKVEPHPEYWELSDLVTQRARGRPVLVLSWAMGSAWPLTYATGAEWSMRFPSLWMVWVLYADQFAAPGHIQYHSDTNEPPQEVFLRDAVASDMERFEPELLIVFSAAPDTPESGLSRLDYLAYFARDPKFAAQLRYYQYLRTIGVHDVYHRVAEPALEGPLRPRPHDLGASASELPPERRAALFGFVGMFQLLVFLFAGVLALAARWHRGAPGA
jgi:hypothetical protein